LLADGPQGEAPSEKRAHAPRREAREPDRPARSHEKSREPGGPRPHRDSDRDTRPRFEKGAGFNKKKTHQGKPAHTGRTQSAGEPFVKPAFKKTPKKKRNG
jgi:ATP-dependent RNA helicase DeaD